MPIAIGSDRDLEILKVLGRAPAWSHGRGQGPASQGLDLAAVVYRGLLDGLTRSLDVADAVERNEDLTAAGKQKQRRDAAEQIIDGLAERHAKQMAQLHRQQRDLEKKVARFLPHVVDDAATRVALEQEVRAMLRDAGIRDAIALQPVYSDAITDGNHLIAAAIENWPRMTIRTADGDAVTGLPADVIRRGRAARMVATDAASAEKLDQLTTALDDLTAAAASVDGAIRDMGGLPPLTETKGDEHVQAA